MEHCISTLHMHLRDEEDLIEHYTSDTNDINTKGNKVQPVFSVKLTAAIMKQLIAKNCSSANDSSIVEQQSFIQFESYEQGKIVIGSNEYKFMIVNDNLTDSYILHIDDKSLQFFGQASKRLKLKNSPPVLSQQMVTNKVVNNKQSAIKLPWLSINNVPSNSMLRMNDFNCFFSGLSIRQIYISNINIGKTSDLKEYFDYDVFIEFETIEGTEAAMLRSGETLQCKCIENHEIKTVNWIVNLSTVTKHEAFFIQTIGLIPIAIDSDSKPTTVSRVTIQSFISNVLTKNILSRKLISINIRHLVERYKCFMSDSVYSRYKELSSITNRMYEYIPNKWMQNDYIDSNISATIDWQRGEDKSSDFILNIARALTRDVKEIENCLLTLKDDETLGILKEFQWNHLSRILNGFRALQLEIWYLYRIFINEEKVDFFSNS